MVELRARICATRADGFVLSSEPPPRSFATWSRLASWTRSNRRTRRIAPTAVVVQRSHFEAAARLGMWSDFDPNLFDALCVCLQVQRMLWLSFFLSPSFPRSLAPTLPPALPPLFLSLSVPPSLPLPLQSLFSYTPIYGHTVWEFGSSSNIWPPSH